MLTDVEGPLVDLHLLEWLNVASQASNMLLDPRGMTSVDSLTKGTLDHPTAVDHAH